MSDTTRAHVLIIDDVLANIELLANTLSPEFSVSFSANGVEGLSLAKRLPINLILLDVVMPGIDGFEVCRRLKADPATQDIPVLFLTSLESAVDEEYGLSLGAEDFLHKPVSPPVVLARVRNHLLLANTKKELKRHNNELELIVAERTQEIVSQNRRIIASQDATIRAFCVLAEARDNETGDHIHRTQNYVRALAEKLRTHPRFSGVLNDAFIRLLFKSAPLHDVGKVAIPDAVLLKPGKLNADEWAIMKTHCEAGWRAIKAAARELVNTEDSFLGCAAEIAYGHHERWDGSGYPHGLAGDDIPVSARLMAVADVYDALISRRVYKKPYSHEESLQIMAAERGTHFDPDVLDAMLAISATFCDIALRYRDGTVESR